MPPRDAARMQFPQALQHHAGDDCLSCITVEMLVKIWELEQQGGWQLIQALGSSGLQWGWLRPEQKEVAV